MSGRPLQSSPLYERFCARDRPIHLTGLQALARLPLEQIRRDRRGGLRVGGFISGYPGSPLAGFDGVLERIAPLLHEHDLRFEAGLNEELATAAQQVEAALKAGGKTVAEVFAEKDQLGGQAVTVRGKVVKTNANIMGKNWLHVRDGSGAEGTNDLTVTTAAHLPSVGDTVLVTGQVSLNKDFGMGYAYDVIVEDAEVKVEESAL